MEQGGHGGAREGAGRKQVLKNPKRVLIILDTEHEAALGKLAKVLKKRKLYETASGAPRLPSRSEVVRYLLETTSIG